MRFFPLPLALSLPLAVLLLPVRAGAEGSTLSSVKVGACALLTAADAQRVSNVPMQVQASAPGVDSPGRTCVYAPARPGPGGRTVQLRLLDAHEWSDLGAEDAARKREMERIKGIGDQAYVVKTRKSRRSSELVLYVRRGGSQFSLRFTGTAQEPTDAMKQLARQIAGRLY